MDLIVLEQQLPKQKAHFFKYAKLLELQREEKE